MGILGWVTLNKCTDNIGCFLFIAIPLLPGALLRLEGVASVVTSLLFWFLLGSLIGFLVYKFKKSWLSVVQGKILKKNESFIRYNYYNT